MATVDDLLELTSRASEIDYPVEKDELAETIDGIDDEFTEALQRADEDHFSSYDDVVDWLDRSFEMPSFDDR